jgi:hypothetical protein
VIVSGGAITSPSDLLQLLHTGAGYHLAYLDLVACNAFNVGFDNLVSSNGTFDASKQYIYFGLQPVQLTLFGHSLLVGANLFADKQFTVPLTWDSLNIESKHGTGSWDMAATQPTTAPAK